jgi:hypothetical protein
MTTPLNFTGFIENVIYKPTLRNPLETYDFAGFDINRVKTSGLIKQNDLTIAYSKWVSPKKSRSYPFAGVYNTYQLPKSLTVIPVIKDEGVGGDGDRFQFPTLSWMNLLNTYIVLAYYSKAQRNEAQIALGKMKITKQQFDCEFVNEQIQEIMSCGVSAYHWNTNLIKERFASIFERAVYAYQEISKSTQIPVRDPKRQLAYIAQVKREFEYFRSLSLANSRRASLRESVTVHALELLGEGDKATILIENYMKGVYPLTPDGVIKKDNVYIIEESKNTKGKLPSISDIKDGLLKLVLFSNLSWLKLNDTSVVFQTRLRLTGQVKSKITLPATEDELRAFYEVNKGNISTSNIILIKALQLEASENHGNGNFSIVIENNQNN